MPDEMIIRFWGVRGSHPVPGPRTVRIGGNTACVEIQAGAHTIILDAGTGIINLGTDLMRRSRAHGGHSITATILFSHMHNDHTQGFPFFEPAYAGASTLHILGPNRVAYLDYRGSGNETARHCTAGGPITVMVCSFDEGDAAIVRLFGKARATPFESSPLAPLLRPVQELKGPGR